jgi:toxin ParE1/3/4
MKRHLRMTERAYADLQEIWDEIGEHSPLNADRFCEQLLKTCETAAEYPLAGRRRTEARGEYYSWAHGNYLILYRTMDDVVEVARIVHGAREIQRVLDSGDL